MGCDYDELRICFEGMNNDGPQFGLSRKVLIDAVDFSQDEIMNFITAVINKI